MNKTLIKALIVEDEENGRLVLKNLLNKHCTNIEIVGMAASVKEAIPLVINEEPDVVFLDIELPGDNGFTLFNHFPPNVFKTIFVTAYNEYALKALKLSAIDYLLKPIDPDELIEAVKKLDDKNLKEQGEKLGNLGNNLNGNLSKIALPAQDGLIFVEVQNILRCEADGNYTTFYFKNKEKMVICKNLSYFDEILTDFSFFRSNRNSLINMNYISKFQRGRKCFVILDDGSEVSVSENKKEEFIRTFSR